MGREANAINEALFKIDAASADVGRAALFAINGTHFDALVDLLKTLREVKKQLEGLEKEAKEVS
jgi:hypothetical protein